MNQQTQHPLLPVGQRVTHFDGGPHTHGKGRIVAYNGQRESAYLKEKPAEAIAIAGQAGLLNALVGGFYSSDRCPYVVQWDPRKDDSDIAKKYPNGYKDVYERESVNAVEEEEVA